MAGQLPGPVCRVLSAFNIDAGTMCRGSSPRPGAVRSGASTAAPALVEYGPPVPALAAPAPAASSAVSPARFDVEKAVAHLNTNAHATSQSACAKYVREAIEAGGIPIPWPRPTYAKDYGPKLTELGFKTVDSKDYVPQKGDVIVLQPPKGQTAGHLEMYNGSVWVSDFVQSERIYPGAAYRRDEVSYEIFRP